MKNIYFFLLGLIIPYNAISQTTVTIPASRDNTIYNENDNSNGKGENIFTGSTNSGALRRAVIYFDLSSIGPATIQSASIKLTNNKTISGGENVSVHKLSAGWGEGTSDALLNEGQGAAPTANDATWNFRFYNTSSWSSPGGDFIATPSATTSVSGPGNYTWSGAQVVADVQGWVSSASTNFGWIIIGNETGTGSAKRFASRENVVAADIPQLTITYTSNLPVKFLSFKGTVIPNGIKLLWETAFEQNNDYFMIEHSLDGRNFQTIEKVKGSGTTTDIKRYDFIHTTSIPGNHYFRIVQTDFDNKVQYSNTILVAVLSSIQKILLYPNPATDKLNIRLSTAQTSGTYQIISANGKIVRKGLLNQLEISLMEIPAGVYFFQTNTINDIFRVPFIKK